jgi:hypothetical protein
MHTEEPHDLGDKIKEDELGRTCDRYGRKNE